MSDSVSTAIRALGGTARTRQIVAAGVHPRHLYAARDNGLIIEVSRGVFRLAEVPMTEPDLVAAALRMPRAVFCLITAMVLHDLTDEIPRAVHVALPRGTRAARMDYPPLEVYHFSHDSYAYGQVEIAIDDVKMRVTNPAKTVADAFKFRNRLGTGVAVVAMREALRTRQATPVQILQAARVCRVHNIVMPYLESQQ